MEIVVKIAQFVLSLSILVILHEFGHFFFAKIFKTRVEKFYLFFNPWFSLFKFKRGETEYGVGWVPLGGYVKISGMIDESMDKEQMKQPPQPYEFRSKKSWQRLLIMLGGVLVNFLLALVIYSLMLFKWGDSYLPNKEVKYGIMVTDSIGYEIGLKDGDHILSLDNKEIDNFYEITAKLLLDDVKTMQLRRNDSVFSINLPDDLISRLIKEKTTIFDARVPYIISELPKESPAKDAGFQAEDQIIGINGIRIKYYDEFQKNLKGYEDKNITVTVLRGSDTIDITTHVTEEGKLGVYAWSESKYFNFKHVDYGFFEAIPAGIKKGFSTLKDYLKQFKLIFSKKHKGYKELGGFITIGKIFPGQWDWQAFWGLTAFLSIILAIMNVLPIPALDGGHVLFLLYEIITGRKPSDKFLEHAQIVGMIILFALLLYANGNDIIKLFK